MRKYRIIFLFIILCTGNCSPIDAQQFEGDNPTRLFQKEWLVDTLTRKVGETLKLIKGIK